MTSRDVDESPSLLDAPPRSGGEPELVGQCTECDAVYPVQTTVNDTLRPIGTDGTCECGNDEFRAPPER